MTTIYELKEGVGFARMVAVYPLEPKAAMVASIYQCIHKDFNTMDYPDEVPGMRQSDTLEDHWYYSDRAGQRMLSAFPQNTCLRFAEHHMRLFSDPGEIRYKREK